MKEGRPKCIMTSYNRVNGTYANENHHLLQDILHGEWGYDGAVVTDWGGSNDHVEGVREGSTLEMPCPGFGSAKRLMQAVEEGRLPESAVDARVDELLELVFTTDAAVKAAPKRFDRDAHHALARCAAAESVVLLKNEDDLLPLKPGQRVALIGDFAQTPRYQGAGSSSVNATRVDNLKDAAEADDITLAGFCAGYERSGTPNPAFVEEAAALARKADVVVLCMGLDESSESEGLDRSHICIPENQKQLLEAVAQANENLVVVLSAGSVVETGWVSRCKAVLHAYLGGQAGAGAIMDVLTGRVNPSGKLARDSAPDLRGHPGGPVFPGQTAERGVPRGPVHRLPLLRNGPCAGALSLRLRPELHYLCLLRPESGRGQGHLYHHQHRQPRRCPRSHSCMWPRPTQPCSARKRS